MMSSQHPIEIKCPSHVRIFVPSRGAVAIGCQPEAGASVLLLMVVCDWLSGQQAAQPGGVLTAQAAASSARSSVSVVFNFGLVRSSSAIPARASASITDQFQFLTVSL